MTAGLLQPTAMLPSGRCHITLSHVKIPLPCDAAFRQNFLTTCCDYYKCTDHSDSVAKTLQEHFTCIVLKFLR